MAAPSTAAVSAAPADANRAPRGLWLWPAVVMVVAYWTFHFTFQAMEVSTFVRFITRMGAHALLFFTFLGWWCVNGRIPRFHRFAALAFAVAGGVAANYFMHPSLGVVGVLTTGIAYVATVWVLSLLLLSRASPALRWSVWAAAVLLVWGSLCLLRMDGLSGEQVAAIHWRWEPSSEDLFLAEQKARAGVAPAKSRTEALLEAEPGDWVAFRNIGRDGAAPPTDIAGDWTSRPPQLIWRKRVGPAWSSLIVVGGRVFTQEQRGEQETVVCYDAANGQELWSHADKARFWDSVSSAGPRATPTFHRGRLVTLGGTGIFNCLDASTGKLTWSHDLAQEAQAPRPQWGFSCSPLVVGNQAIVFAGGNQKPSLLAYDIETGEQSWSLDAGPGSYSSPQLATLGGQDQVLFLSDMGLFSVDPATGKKLWDFAIAIPGAPISIQPHVVDENKLLVASVKEGGVVLLEVKPSGAGWLVEQRWVSLDLKPSFNDFVVHKGHAYGFDGSIFACIDLKTGKRQWKKGRYGYGQVIALPDRDQLLVLSESGEVILLAADPERHQELGKFQAIVGKTWNHPALSRGRLFVRNAEEMACYDLSGTGPPAGSTPLGAGGSSR